MLMKRSITIASAQSPWLAAAATESDAMTSLRDVMQEQEPAAITDAFVAVLTTLVALLNRLIGEGLVDRLLNEVWPAVFVPAAKDTP